MHIELITATAVAAAATGTAAAAIAGDSLIVKNAIASKGVSILAAWQTNQTAGFGQIAFPSAHDTTRGYRAGVPVGVNPAFLPMGVEMPVTPQESMAVTVGATAVAGDVEQMSLLMWYGDFPGINGRLITAAQAEARTDKLTTVETSIPSTAGPSYGTELVITTGSDLLRANRDYAVLGMTSRTAVHNMTMRGPDFGNVRVACPGVLRQEITAQWFMLLSRVSGKPTVPVFNSGNKSSTFVGVTTDENAGTFVTTLYLAMLK